MDPTPIRSLAPAPLEFGGGRGRSASARKPHRSHPVLRPCSTVTDLARLRGWSAFFAHDNGSMVGQHLDRSGVDDRRKNGAHVGHRRNVLDRHRRFFGRMFLANQHEAPPRAATCCMFETVFSNATSRGAITMTGIASPISAIGPCFNSAAA